MDLSTGVFGGTGSYDPNPGYSWDITSGVVVGSDIDFTITYNNLGAGYSVILDGVIASNGSMSGTAVSSSGQTFTWTSPAGSATFRTSGVIIEPEVNEIVYGSTDLVAIYYDESPSVNDDIVQWAVRKGTCAAGTGTVFGNVDGYSDPYNWDGRNFDAVMDTSSMSPGQYCFVFNPKDDTGQNNVRETRNFWIADAAVYGGGHILEEIGSKKKDWLDVSFGGGIYRVGPSSYIGDWQVNLHNVNKDAFDKGKFHGTNVTSLNLYNGNSLTCNAAMNMTVWGEFNHQPGYSMIFRAGDFGSPNTIDTVRVELYDPSGTRVYDTHWGAEFTDESSCVGGARTILDTGNITIYK
jgi:hypothetical protein